VGGKGEKQSKGIPVGFYCLAADPFHVGEIGVKEFMKANR
jgi:hypothetical protein